MRVHMSQLFCSWVRAVVDLGELSGGELSVTLGGAEPLVAKQFLDGAQVCTFFQQMSAKGVAQSVRVNVR